MGAQLLLQSFVRVLGQDLSSLSDGVLQYYPSIAALETVKIIFAVSIAFVPILWALDSALTISRRTNGRIRYYVVLTGIFSGFFSALFASYLQFPALYENYLPERINTAVFYLSDKLTPTSLNIAALCLFIFAGFAATELKFANKRTLGGCAVIVLLFSVAITAASPMTGQYVHDTKRPNILFIAVDSLRFDKIRDSTLMPRVGELLKLPTTASFLDHHVGIPRTFPSWVEILEGKYGAQTGIRHMFPGLLQLRKRTVTLPHILGDLGYETSVVSDFAGDIFPRFDTGFQVVKAPAMNLQTMIQVNVDMMFPLFFPVLLTHLGRTIFSSLDESPAFADPDWLSTKAIVNMNQTMNKPFFMTVFFSTAHFPYATPWPFYSSHSNKDYRGAFKFQKNPDVNGKGVQISGEDVEQVRNLYNGALGAIDASIGKLLDELRDKDLLKDTMIIVTADHGEDLFDSGNIHGHGEHLIGDTVLHVPWVLKFPDTVAVNQRNIGTLSRSIDIAPTILDFLGQNHSMMEGMSLLPTVLQGITQSTPDGSYSETGIWFSNKGNSHFQKMRLDYPSISQLLSFDPGGTKEVILNEKYEHIIETAKHRSLTLGDYKIIYMPTAEGIVYKLFDRRTDPENLHDLASAEPEALALMTAKFLSTVEKLEGPDRLVQGYVVQKR
jgi:arylsulfatase A-like enzyme